MLKKSPNFYEQIGGEPALRWIVEQLVERMTQDVLIGFFFQNVNKKRLAEFEYQHAAAFLGGPVSYRGRDLTVAHHGRGIQGGHFARRLQILREVLQAAKVPQAICDAWILHNASLKSKIVNGAA